MVIKFLLTIVATLEAGNKQQLLNSSLTGHLAHRQTLPKLPKLFTVRLKFLRCNTALTSRKIDVWISTM